MAWLPVAGSWLLIAGSWFLIAGCWSPTPRRHALSAPSLAYYLHAHPPLPRLLRSWSSFSRARPCRLSTLPQHVLCSLAPIIPGIPFNTTYLPGSRLSRPRHTRLPALLPRCICTCICIAVAILAAAAAAARCYCSFLPAFLLLLPSVHPHPCRRRTPNPSSPPVSALAITFPPLHPKERRSTAIPLGCISLGADRCSLETSALHGLPAASLVPMALSPATCNLQAASRSLQPASATLFCHFPL